MPNRTIKVKEDFIGYPDGDNGQPVEYVKGQEVSVPKAFADLVESKGHATVAKSETTETKAEAKSEAK